MTLYIIFFPVENNISSKRIPDNFLPKVKRKGVIRQMKRIINKSNRNTGITVREKILIQYT